MNIVFRPTRLNRDFLRQEFLPMLRTCFEAFLILCAIFAAMTFLLPDFVRAYLTLIEELIASLGLETGTTSWQIFSTIFSNNVRATVVTVFYGYLPFLFYPALTLGSNALSITALGISYVQDGLLSPAAFFAGILPHGIFEIPALIIACAIGLCNCRFITRMVLKKPMQTEPRAQLVMLSRLYFILVLPLLLIAAAVEAFVTPYIMALFL